MGLNLQSTVSLTSANFERGMSRVRSSVTDGIKSFVLGAIGVATLEQAFMRTVETAKNLVNEAARLDMTVEQVQILGQAAKDAGKDFDVVAAAIGKVNLFRAKYLAGDKAAMSAAKVFGITRQDVTEKRGSDLFTGKISDKVKSSDVQQIAAPLREILGKGASEVVGVLKTNFATLEEKMRAMGAIMDGDVALKLDKMSDDFSLVSKVLTSAFAPVILQAAIALLKLLDAAVSFAEWVDRKTGIGKAAKTAGALTGQTGSIRGTGKILDDILGQDIKNLFHGKGFKISEEQRQDILKKNNVNPSQLDKDIKDSAGDPFIEWSDKLKKTIDGLVTELESPAKAPPKIPVTPLEQKSVAEKQFKPASDSLIKVGNFLGSSKGVINSAQAMLVQHAAQTVKNTERTAKAVEDLSKEIQQSPSSPNGGTIWPAN